MDTEGLRGDSVDWYYGGRSALAEAGQDSCKFNWSDG